MDSTVLESVLDVFSGIGGWFAEFVPTMFALFYTPGVSGAPGSLTFLGVLSCAGLGLSIIFLILGLISNFMHFRGVYSLGGHKSKVIDRFFSFVSSKFNLVA